MKQLALITKFNIIGTLNEQNTPLYLGACCFIEQNPWGSFRIRTIDGIETGQWSKGYNIDWIEIDNVSSKLWKLFK